MAIKSTEGGDGSLSSGPVYRFGSFMVFFRHGWRAGLDPNSESRDLWQRANIHKSPRPQFSQIKKKKNVDQQGTGGKERNKDVFEFGMDWMEGVDIFQSKCLAV